MKNFTLTFLTFVTVIVPADAGIETGANSGADISAPAQVSALHAVQEKLDTVSDTIMDCIAAGTKHRTCMCKHRKLVISFNTEVKSLFANYPELLQHDIVRFRSPHGTWISQSLNGIKKQAEINPVCD